MGVNQPQTVIACSHEEAITVLDKGTNPFLVKIQFIEQFTFSIQNDHEGDVLTDIAQIVLTTLEYCIEQIIIFLFLEQVYCLAYLITLIIKCEKTHLTLSRLGNDHIIWTLV